MEKNHLKLRFPKPGESEAIETIMQQVQTLHVKMRPDIYKPVSPLMTEERLAEFIEQKTALVAVRTVETAGAIKAAEASEVSEVSEAEEYLEAGKETIVAYADWFLREYQSPTHVARRILFLDTLAVEETCRGQGIGTKMMDWILTYAREKGMDGVELQVNARNAGAKRMYERYGFGEKSVNMEIKL